MASAWSVVPSAYGGISVAYGERAAVDGASGGGVVQCVVFWGFAKAIAECQLCALAPVVLGRTVVVAVAAEAKVVGHRGLDGDVVAKVNEMGGRDVGDNRGVVFVADVINQVATVVIAVGDGVGGGADAGVGVGDKAANECTDASLNYTVDGDADCGIDDVAVLDSGIYTFSGNGADEDGLGVSRDGYSWTYEDDVPDGAAADVAEKSNCAVAVAAVDGETADGIIAAVVGTFENFTTASAYRREVAAAAEVDVGGLAEGLAAAVVSCVDGCSQVAQVISSGDGIGGGASFGGHAEVAELGAALRGEAAPVARGVRLLSRDAGEDDVLQFVVVLEDITGEANGAVMLDVDALEAHAVLEGALVQAGHAGGQGDGDEGVAVVESILADSGNTVADSSGSQTLTTDEGEMRRCARW